MTLVLKVDDLGTVPSTVPMSSMSKPAPLDPAQFSLSRHGHPVQNGEIFFVSKSLGAWYCMVLVSFTIFYCLAHKYTCSQQMSPVIAFDIAMSSESESPMLLYNDRHANLKSWMALSN